jgi:hypothetical protein
MPKHARLAEHRLADWQVSHVIRCHAPKPDTSNWPLPGPVRRPSDRPTCPLRLAAAPERNLAQCLVIGAHVRNWLAHSSSRSCGAEPIPRLRMNALVSSNRSSLRRHQLTRTLPSERRSRPGWRC